MNIGCIPSKSLLKIAEFRTAQLKLKEMGLLDNAVKPEIRVPFPKISEYLEYISSKKTLKMFEKVHLILGEGPASFVDSHTVAVNGKTITARRIFSATA